MRNQWHHHCQVVLHDSLRQIDYYEAIRKYHQNTPEIRNNIVEKNKDKHDQYSGIVSKFPNTWHGIVDVAMHPDSIHSRQLLMNLR